MFLSKADKGTACIAVVMRGDSTPAEETPEESHPAKRLRKAVSVALKQQAQRMLARSNKTLPAVTSLFSDFLQHHHHHLGKKEVEAVSETECSFSFSRQHVNNFIAIILFPLYHQ